MKLFLQCSVHLRRTMKEGILEEYHLCFSALNVRTEYTCNVKNYKISELLKNSPDYGHLLCCGLYIIKIKNSPKELQSATQPFIVSLHNTPPHKQEHCVMMTQRATVQQTKRSAAFENQNPRIKFSNHVSVCNFTDKERGQYLISSQSPMLQLFLSRHTMMLGGVCGRVVNTSNSGSGGLGFKPHPLCCFLRQGTLLHFASLHPGV